MDDVVIVGAGSAGCVLANRLSEDPGTRVLLLEAGGSDKAKEVRIPAAFSKNFKTARDWDYTTAPQAALGGRELYWPRGKVLGGSSSINAMIYMRGHRADYDGWAGLGNDGWGYEEVLPYFRKAEHNERGASRYHGGGGPLNVADLRTVNPLTRAYLAAGTALGLAANDDFNGAEQDGVGLFQVTQKKGKRHSAATAYLRKALGRPNLTVATDAHATRVLVEDGRAVGVVYRKDGVEHLARAREVVLAGGAINSPQLLLLSGIGPAAHLRELGIPLLHELPGVGRNLQDHLAIGAGYTATKPVSLLAAESLGNIARYLLTGKGMLSSNVAEAGGFIRTRPELPAPDCQLLFGPVIFEGHGLTPPSQHGFSTGAYLLQPRSRGTITLASADPFAKPVIDPGYLSDPDGEDLRVLLEGLRLCLRILEHEAFAPWRGEPYLPERGVRGDEQLAQFVRERCETIYHPAGTCKMGVDDDAVVDPELRVRGVAGLRVIDASIMPTVVRGNTNAPTMMIAEKGADLVKQAAGRPATAGRADPVAG